METRRLMNDAMPRGLVWAQLGLYAWAGFGVLRAGVLASRGDLAASALFLAVVFGVVRAIAAYGISNESAWGWWLGLATCALTVLPTLDDLVHQLSLLARPDFVALLIIPLGIALCLLEPASRDFVRVWFR